MLILSYQALNAQRASVSAVEEYSAAADELLTSWPGLVSLLALEQAVGDQRSCPRASDDGCGTGKRLSRQSEKYTEI